MVTEPLQGWADSRPADPSASKRLMVLTYVVGGIGLAISFWYQGNGSRAAAAAWAAAVGVGATGLVSFVRHSVFHRSDAVRMGWDYGRRNDFQIEVGFANLAWGLVGIAAWALDWGARAQGAVVLIFGLYMMCATILHVTELRHDPEQGGGRLGPVIGSAAFSVALLAAGGSAVASM
jgi:hypothetical protein